MSEVLEGLRGTPVQVVWGFRAECSVFVVAASLLLLRVAMFSFCRRGPQQPKTNGLLRCCCGGGGGGGGECCGALFFEAGAGRNNKKDTRVPGFRRGLSIARNNQTRPQDSPPNTNPSHKGVCRLRVVMCVYTCMKT